MFFAWMNVIFHSLSHPFTYNYTSIPSQRLTQDVPVDKVNQAVILQKVILDRGPWQQNSFLYIHSTQSLIGLVLWVFQTVSLEGFIQISIVIKVN